MTRDRAPRGGRSTTPLLVTGLVNVRYLTGFESSNTALARRPGRRRDAVHRLPLRGGGARVDGVDVRADAARRRRRRSPSGCRAGGSRFEAAHISLARRRDAARGRRRARPDDGARRGAARGQGAGRARRACAARRRSRTASTRSSAGSAFVGRTEAELAWWLEQALARARARTDPSFDAIVAFGENGARPHAKLRDVPIPERDARRRRRGLHRRRLPLRLHAHVLHRRARRAARASSTTCACSAQLDALAAVAARRARPGRRRRLARRDRARPAWASSYGHGLGHGVGLDVHEEPNMRPESEAVLAAGQRRHRRAGDLPAGDVGVRIEDMVVVTEDGCERLTTVTKEPVLVG